MTFSRSLALICALGAGLRIARFPLRWNQIAFAYAAYQAPFEDALREGRVIDALGTFYGLHPPLYSALFALAHLGLGSLGAVMALSCALSVAAVALVGALGRSAYGDRVGLVAAAMMALSHYHLSYSLEINNYPLLVFLVAASHLSFAHRLRGHTEGHWILWQTLSHWCHLLGGLVGAAQGVATLAIREMRRRGAVALLWIALGTLPLLPEIVRLLGTGSTYHNEVGEAGALLTGVMLSLVERFGHPLGFVLGGVAASLGTVLGARRPSEMRITRYLALATGVSGVGILALTALGVSAAHQHPYYLILLPPFLTLGARGVVGLGNAGILLALPLILLPPMHRSLEESRLGWDAWSAARAQPHALRGALDAARARQDDTPTALWLVAPALLPDDEKVAPDGAYAFIDPRWRCAFYTPRVGGFETTNYQQGQPYTCRLGGGSPRPRRALAPGDVALYTFTDVYPGAMPPLAEAHLLQGTPLEVVLYDVAITPDYLPALRRVLTAAADAQGAQLLERAVGATVWFSLTPAAPRGGPQP